MSTPSDALVDSVAWEICEPPTENPENLPYPVRKGVLQLGEIKLDCYVLNTGQRIFSGEAFEKLICEMFQV